MFSADLTWDGGPTERVGERRERKVKEKAGSIKSVDQARPGSNRRWLSTKKTSLDVSVTSIGLSCTSNARPDTATTTTTALPPQTPLPKYSFDGDVPSRTFSRKGSKRVAPPPDPTRIKDPEDQPDEWILAGRLSRESTKPAYHRQAHSSKSQARLCGTEAEHGRLRIRKAGSYSLGAKVPTSIRQRRSKRCRGGAAKVRL